MTNACIIAGTDTGVGKTIFSAALMLALETYYWKPVQSGVSEGIDTRIVQQITGLPDERFFPERYILTEPLSPHRAAELDHLEIDVHGLELPQCDGKLLIEGAGGLMVPLTRKNLQVNLFKRWNLPVILCARTTLGTINHTLLSLEALWSREIPIHGVAFIGEENEDTFRIIQELSGVKILGCLPWLHELNPENLRQAFADHFNFHDFFSLIPHTAAA